MLKINSKSMDFNGVSTVEDVVVASLHASYSGADMYMSMNVSNVAAYAEHKEIVSADMAAFCAEVVNTILTAGVERAEDEE